MNNYILNNEDELNSKFCDIKELIKCSKKGFFCNKFKKNEKTILSISNSFNGVERIKLVTLS